MLIALQDTAALVLHDHDDVAIALRPLPPGGSVELPGRTVRTTGAIGAGHKLALHAIDTGRPVHRYGQVIGFATQPIVPGDHVHTHNLAVGDMQLDYQLRRRSQAGRDGASGAAAHVYGLPPRRRAGPARATRSW